MSRIRLAWWREALERLDTEAPPPEPVLRALAEHVLPGGITGAELAGMEEAWALLLSEAMLTGDELNRYGCARGGRLFLLSARLLGVADFPAEESGKLWALVDLARHSASPEEAKSAFEAAEPGAMTRWPRPLRPLGMLDMLARRDVERGLDIWERQGSPARMLRMIRHRLSGT